MEEKTDVEIGKYEPFLRISETFGKHVLEGYIGIIMIKLAFIIFGEYACLLHTTRS